MLAKYLHRFIRKLLTANNREFISAVSIRLSDWRVMGFHF